METSQTNAEAFKRPEFRELEKIQRWAGVLSTKFDLESLEKALKDYVGDSSLKLFGYLQSTKDGTEYHFNRYPRKKYAPIPTSEELDAVLADMAKLGETRTDNLRTEAARVKTLLALGEGYNGTIFHTPEEAIAILGEDFDVSPVKIFSVNENGVYEADAITIEGNRAGLQNIYELADKFKQHRFTVEDLQNGTINLVETRWCKDPDES